MAYLAGEKGQCLAGWHMSKRSDSSGTSVLVGVLLGTLLNWQDDDSSHSTNSSKSRYIDSYPDSLWYGVSVVPDESTGIFWVLRTSKREMVWKNHCFPKDLRAGVHGSEPQ